MYIGIVLEGIEDIAAAEVKGKIKEKGRITFEKLKKEYEVIDTVYEYDDEFTFETQEDILERIKKRKWKIEEPFRVTCRRKGQHLFSGNDIEKDVGEVIHELGYAVSLKEPKTIVYVDIQDNKCILGKLLGNELEKRAYRIRRNNAGISASFAAAAIKISKISPEESMYDPYAKDGVIAIEAARQGIKKIYATDQDENNLRNAKINAKMAKVNIHWEEISEVDYIITNLWVPARQERSKEYAIHFLEKSEDKVKKKLIVVTNWIGLEKRIPEGWSVEEKRMIQNAEIKNYIFVLKRKR